MSEPKKVDRRKFIYAGLGAVALIAIGAAAYVAMNPPVVTQTVTTSTTSVITQPTTTVVTTTVPTTTVITTTPTKTPVGEVVIKTITQTGGLGDPSIPIFDAFNKRFAGTMKVEWMTEPFASLQDRIFTTLLTHSDEFHMIPYHTNFIGALGDHYEDLNMYLEKYKDDPQWRVNLSDFPEGLVKTQCIWKGKLIGLPFRIGSHACLFYRKDLYEQKGLKPPRTIEEYIENARKLNNPPNIYGGSVRGRAGQDIAEDFLSWLYAYGADIFNEDQTGTTPYPSKHSEVAEKIINGWIQMDKEGLLPPGWLNQSSIDQVTNMQQGLLAQMNEFTPRSLTVEDPKTSKVVGKVGYIRLLKDNPDTIGPPHAYGAGWQLGINKYVKSGDIKDACYKLIVWMTSWEMQYLAATQWANGPTRIDVMNNPDFLKKVPVASAHLDCLSVLKGISCAQYAESFKIISDELQLALTGKKPVSNAVEDMWKKIGALFQR